MSRCKPGDIARINRNDPMNEGALVAVLHESSPAVPHASLDGTYWLPVPGVWWLCTTLSELKSTATGSRLPPGSECKIADSALDPQNPPPLDDDVKRDVDKPIEMV